MKNGARRFLYIPALCAQSESAEWVFYGIPRSLHQAPYNLFTFEKWDKR